MRAVILAIKMCPLHKCSFIKTKTPDSGRLHAARNGWGDLRGFTWQRSTHTAAYISGSEHARSVAGYVRRPLKKKGVEKAARPSARLKVLPSAVPLCQNIQSSSRTLVTYRVCVWGGWRGVEGVQHVFFV